MAYHLLLPLPYDTVLNLHIITGQLMLVAMPYTRLAHMIAFFVVRLAKPAAMQQHFDTNSGAV
jgi:nitrate reductase gamma subunit